MHPRGVQRGRRGPALARERQHRARGPTRRGRAGGDGPRRPPGALAAKDPTRRRRGDYAHPARTCAGRGVARAHPHLPDARPRLPRSRVGTRHVEGPGRGGRRHVDPGRPGPHGSAPPARAAVLPGADWGRRGARRARAARHRSARAIGIRVDPRPGVVNTGPSTSRGGPYSFTREGLGWLQRDAYHFLLDASWSKLLVILLSLYLAVNAVFAAAYLLEPGAIENARPG